MLKGQLGIGENVKEEPLDRSCVASVNENASVIESIVEIEDKQSIVDHGVGKPLKKWLLDFNENDISIMHSIIVMVKGCYIIDTMLSILNEIHEVSLHKQLEIGVEQSIPTKNLSLLELKERQRNIYLLIKQ